MSAPGNDKVISLLETLLAHARGGNTGYLIACMVDQNGHPVGGWHGTSALELVAMKALEHMAVQMDAEVLNKELPERDPSVSADRACFNFPRSPVSYDFINWLVDAEMNRRMKGAPAPLKVAFWFGRDGNIGFESAARQQMFLNVMRPALALIGAVEDQTAVDGHYKPFFTLRDVVRATKRGFEVPKLRARYDYAEWAQQKAAKQAPITITLREMDLQPYRNSNIKAWLKLARHLRDQGERVIFVRDTAKARDKMETFETRPEASLDLHARMALYETAKLNLFVSNGPSTLALFSAAPWLTFTRIEPDGHEYAPNTPTFWRDNFGIEVGEQFPWSRPDQRMIWKADDYETLIAAWKEIEPLLTHEAPAQVRTA